MLGIAVGRAERDGSASTSGSIDPSLRVYRTTEQNPNGNAALRQVHG